MWTTGLVPHPADEHPLPTESGHVCIIDRDGRELVLSEAEHMFHGDVVVEGSCSRKAFSDLDRASWALSFLGEGESDFVVTVKGPVWSTLPQSSAAAET